MRNLTNYFVAAINLSNSLYEGGINPPMVSSDIKDETRRSNDLSGLIPSSETSS